MVAVLETTATINAQRMWMFTPTVGVLFVTILKNMNNIKNVGGDLVTRREKTITSIEIARLAKRNHKDILRSIRSMEPAWEKVNGRKFALVDYTDRKGERRPMYELTKMESLYAIAKFDDEVRARLVHRWYELEKASYKAMNKTGKYELKSRRRVLPRDRGEDMRTFYDELTRWVTHKDVRVIAEMCGVSTKHVTEVLRGREPSYQITALLVVQAKANRKRGIERVVVTPHRDEEVRELMFDFLQDA